MAGAALAAALFLCAGGSMKIRGLTLENVRKFAGRRCPSGVWATDHGDLRGQRIRPKSTFFDAIQGTHISWHSERNTRRERQIGRIVTARRGRGVRIELEIEIEGGALCPREALSGGTGGVGYGSRPGTVIAAIGEGERMDCAPRLALRSGAVGMSSFLRVRQGVYWLCQTSADPGPRSASGALRKARPCAIC